MNAMVRGDARKRDTCGRCGQRGTAWNVCDSCREDLAYEQMMQARRVRRGMATAQDVMRRREGMR